MISAEVSVRMARFLGRDTARQTSGHWPRYQTTAAAIGKAQTPRLTAISIGEM